MYIYSFIMSVNKLPFVISHQLCQREEREEAAGTTENKSYIFINSEYSTTLTDTSSNFFADVQHQLLKGRRQDSEDI